MTATSPRPHTDDGNDRLTGLLVLVACLFTALICLGFGILWLLDESRQPGRWLIAMPLVAVAALGVSAFADTTWSVRRTRTSELGNTTRLVAIGAVLLAVPSMLIAFAGDDDRTDATAGGIERACPSNRVGTAGFTDLPADSTHAPAVDCLVWWGVLSVDGPTFSPTGTVSRGLLATMIDRVATAAGAEPSGAGAGATTFTDVEGTPHAESIARVSAAGLMGGLDDQTFDPGGIVTREQLATLVTRTYEHLADRSLPAPTEGQAEFDDIADSVHARNIRAAAAAGILSGDGGSFNPGAAVTRAQMSTMLARTLDRLVGDGVADLPS